MMGVGTRVGTEGMYVMGGGRGVGKEGMCVMGGGTGVGLKGMSVCVCVCVCVCACVRVCGLTSFFFNRLMKFTVRKAGNFRRRFASVTATRVVAT